MNCGNRFSALIGSWRPTTARTSPLPSAARPRPRICRRRALPGSTTAFSTCAAPTHCSRPAAAASPRIFTDRAIFYRIDNGFDHFKVGALRRRDEDGAGRPRRERRHVHARHRIRLPRCRVHHRRVRARREYRAGHASIRTNSTCTSRPSAPAIAPFFAARSAASSCA